MRVMTPLAPPVSMNLPSGDTASVATLSVHSQVRRWRPLTVKECRERLAWEWATNSPC